MRPEVRVSLALGCAFGFCAVGYGQDDPYEPGAPPPGTNDSRSGEVVRIDPGAGVPPSSTPNAPADPLGVTPRVSPGQATPKTTNPTAGPEATPIDPGVGIPPESTPTPVDDGALDAGGSGAGVPTRDYDKTGFRDEVRAYQERQQAFENVPQQDAAAIARQQELARQGRQNAIRQPGAITNNTARGPARYDVFPPSEDSRYDFTDDANGVPTSPSDTAAGGRMLSDGTMLMPDGTRVLADGTRVMANGTRVLADGTIVDASGMMVNPPRTAAEARQQRLALRARQNELSRQGYTENNVRGPARYDVFPPSADDRYDFTQQPNARPLNETGVPTSPSDINTAPGSVPGGGPAGVSPLATTPGAVAPNQRGAVPNVPLGSNGTGAGPVQTSPGINAGAVANPNAPAYRDPAFRARTSTSPRFNRQPATATPNAGAVTPDQRGALNAGGSTGDRVSGGSASTSGGGGSGSSGSGGGGTSGGGGSGGGN